MPNTALPPFSTYTPYMPSEPLPVAFSVPFSTVSLPPLTEISALLSKLAPFSGPVILPLPVIVRLPVSPTVNSSGVSDFTSCPSRFSVTAFSTMMFPIATSFSRMIVSLFCAAVNASASVAYSVLPILATPSVHFAVSVMFSVICVLKSYFSFPLNQPSKI